MKRGLAFLFLAVLAAGAGAHKDRILTLLPDGSIPELPAPYEATRLHVDFKGPGVSALAAISLSVPGHELRLPACLLAQIPPGSKETLELLGSWYHDLAAMPPYVELRIRPAKPGHNLTGEQGVELLFSLSDAVLMSAQQVVLLDGNKTTWRKLDVSCHELSGRIPPA